MKLHTHDLTIKIDSQFICQALHLEIKTGQLWGILGPNGCGKTTLLHSLAGLRSVLAGKIYLDNNELSQLKLKQVAQCIGILFQDFNAIFPQTVWDYCLASRFPHLPYLHRESAYDKKIVAEALELLSLTAFTSRPINQLSGGEKRRLAIAAVLAQTPAIYLLDEPTNHLDIKYQIQVLNYFKNLTQRKSAAVVMTLHDINLAQQFCDHLLLLFPKQNLYGPTEVVLNAANLTELYQHPILAIPHSHTTYWQAKV